MMIMDPDIGCLCFIMMCYFCWFYCCLTNSSNIIDVHHPNISRFFLVACARANTHKTILKLIIVDEFCLMIFLRIIVPS